MSLRLDPQGSGANAAGARLRLGIDIGGTFTDIALVDDRSGDLAIEKTLTTPDDPSDGIVTGLTRLFAETGRRPAEIEFVVHATTLATNTVIERSGARVGLITTNGFRDILAMGREYRFDIYDLFFDLPEPLVPRHLRRGVTERVDRDGQIVRPVNLGEAESELAWLVDQGVEAIAVCFLHAYANPAHELAVRDLAQRRWPGLPVTVSCDVLPEIREYERTLATVMNAYLQPRMRRYLSELEQRLGALGIHSSIFVMLSSGGVTTLQHAASQPVRIVESGPAAGAIAAAALGLSGDRPNLISFDMGGTTAKSCLIRNGEPTVGGELEIARVSRFKRGSGFPIRVPSVELIEIGAGGGSIARIDSLGLLKVGPDSAGAKPGPVCYGRGGVEPTVTDADLVLGYLDPARFARGTMTLDPAAARTAIETRIGESLGLDGIAAAWGIHDRVNEDMATATRMHIVERGGDPRAFALMAFGGAGPVHAQAVARKLAISTVVVPPAAGALSALGLLAAPLAVEASRSWIVPLERFDPAPVEAVYVELEERARRALGVEPEGLTAYRSVDVRFRGQGSEVNVPLGTVTGEAMTAGAIEAGFRAAYALRFGERLPAAPVEAVTWRIRLQSPASGLPAPRLAIGGSEPEARQREAYFKEGGFVRCQVWRRDTLPPGFAVEGPALIEEGESTTVIAPGQQFEVAADGSLVIKLARPTESGSGSEPSLANAATGRGGSARGGSDA